MVGGKHARKSREIGNLGSRPAETVAANDHRWPALCQKGHRVTDRFRAYGTRRDRCDPRTARTDFFETRAVLTDIRQSPTWPSPAEVDDQACPHREGHPDRANPAEYRIFGEQAEDMAPHTSHRPNICDGVTSYKGVDSPIPGLS